MFCCHFQNCYSLFKAAWKPTVLFGKILVRFGLLFIIIYHIKIILYYCFIIIYQLIVGFQGGTSSDQPTWLIPKKPQLKLARSHPVLEMLDLPRLGGAFSLSCKNWMANIPEKKTSYLGFLVKSKQKYAISIDRSTKF